MGSIRSFFCSKSLGFRAGSRVKGLKLMASGLWHEVVGIKSTKH